MNPALLERLEDARWSGQPTVSVKISELDAMVAEVVQLRQEKIQLERDAKFNENERLLGFVKVEAIDEMRRSKSNSCRILRYKHAPYFIVPVYLKLSSLRSILQCKNPSQK